MPKILVVDDDVRLSEQIQEFLLLEDYVVEVANDGADAMQMLNAFKYDLILLDWNLPDTTGLSICKSYRHKGGTTPVIFLTGKDSIDNKAEGLNEGADDYITKPFHPKELAARVKACLRRPPVLHFESLVAGDLCLDKEHRKLVKAGKEVHLRPLEYALMEFFMRHPNRYFSSRQLIESIWGSDCDTTEDTVRTSIKTLRKKIADANEDCAIKTTLGFGYRLEVSN